MLFSPVSKPEGKQSAFVIEIILLSGGLDTDLAIARPYSTTDVLLIRFSHFNRFQHRRRFIDCLLKFCRRI